MDYEQMKLAAARAALDYVSPDEVLGVGSGSTVDHFIHVLGESGVRPRAAVAASENSASLLEAQGVRVVDLAEDILPLGLYVDGADEVDVNLRLIKGGGGALTREKVIATASRLFFCIVDESKLSARLGTFPVAVEVVPMAVHAVAREIRVLGGDPVSRGEYVTDNGNAVLDVRGLDLEDAEMVERALDAIPGVVECGIFAHRRADVLLVGTQSGVRTIAE